MAKVLGIGGIFFKSPDPKRLYEWYAKCLRMNFEDWGNTYYPNIITANGQTVWSAFLSETKYFEPSSKDFMFNLVVDNLEEALEQVKEGGAAVIGQLFDRLGWFAAVAGVFAALGLAALLGLGLRQQR